MTHQFLAPIITNRDEIVCGEPEISPKLPGQKILNGEEAVPHSFPWQVALLSIFVALNLWTKRPAIDSIIHAPLSRGVNWKRISILFCSGVDNWCLELRQRSLLRSLCSLPLLDFDRRSLCRDCLYWWRTIIDLLSPLLVIYWLMMGIVQKIMVKMYVVHVYRTCEMFWLVKLLSIFWGRDQFSVGLSLAKNWDCFTFFSFRSLPFKDWRMDDKTVL